MNKTIFFFLFILFSVLFFSCTVHLPGGYTVDEYRSVILEGEEGSSVIPNLSFCTRRQVKVLGGQLSLGLGFTLIDRYRFDEAEHLLSLAAGMDWEGWSDYAETLLQFLHRRQADNPEGLKTGKISQQGKEESDYLKDQAVKTLRGSGINDFSDFIAPFIFLPAGDIHRELLEQFYSSGYTLADLDVRDRELIEGKLFLLERDFTAARELLKLVLQYGYGGTHGVVEDLIKIYRRTSKLTNGGEFLFSAAMEIVDSDDERRRLLLGAGRLFRWAGEYERGATVLETAWSETAAEGDQRILWYLQDCLLKSDPQKAVDVLARYAPYWSDPGYFSDIIEELISFYLRNSRWKELEEILPVVLEYGSDESSAGILYIYARLGEVGIYSGNSLHSTDADPDLSDSTWTEIFHEVTELVPGSYYAWLSRMRLGNAGGTARSISSGNLAVTSSLSQGLCPPKKADPILFLLTELGYYSLAFTWLDEWYSGSPEDDKVSFLKLADKLQDDDLWLDSIRLITRLSRNLPLEARDPLELELYYPRAYRKPVEELAEKYDHNPALLFGLIREESGFTASIESWAGAVGLMQIMPSTAEDVAARMEMVAWDLKNPKDNLEMGSWYLDWLEGYVGGLMPAVLSYNGGPGRIKGYMADLNDLPPDLFSEALPMAETRKYGPKVLVSCLYYGYLYYGISPESTIGSFFPEL